MFLPSLSCVPLLPCLQMCKEFVGLDITEEMPLASLALLSMPAAASQTAAKPPPQADQQQHAIVVPPDRETPLYCPAAPAGDVESQQGHGGFPSRHRICALDAARCAVPAKAASSQPAPPQPKCSSAARNTSTNRTESNGQSVGSWMDSFAFTHPTAAGGHRSSSMLEGRDNREASQEASAVVPGAPCSSLSEEEETKGGDVTAAPDPVQKGAICHPLQSIPSGEQVASSNPNRTRNVEAASGDDPKKVLPSPLASLRSETSGGAARKKLRWKTDIFSATLDM